MNNNRVFQFDKNVIEYLVINNNINENSNDVPILIVTGGFILLLFIIYVFREKSLINKNLKIIKFSLLILAILLLIININYRKSHLNPVLNYVNNINDENYTIVLVKNLLSNEECETLLNEIKKLGRPFEISQVYEKDENKVTDYRNSKQIWIQDNESTISKKITNIAKIFTGKPVENMEELQVVEYDISGYFKEHYDPTVDDSKSNIKDRAYTLLFYLNDVEEGGETYFNKLDIKINPSKGDAVFFKSLNETNGKLLINSLHQGTNVKKGKKIICNKWIHLNKFNK